MRAPPGREILSDESAACQEKRAAFKHSQRRLEEKEQGGGGERKSLGVGSPEIWGGVVGTWNWSLDALWSPACCSRVGSTACLKSVEWRQQLGPVKLVLSGFLSGFTDLPEKRP